MRFQNWLLTTCLLLLLTACQTEVYKGLTQRDANEMIAILSHAGIAAKREAVDATTYRITVVDDKLAPAIDALKKAGYPRENYRTLGEVFPGDGLVVSPYEQRIRMMFALNQEISRTINTIGGVVSARVHIVVPDIDLRGVPMNKPSASVVVHHRPNIDEAELTTKIRYMVANAVQGLNSRDVSVALFIAGSDGSELTAARNGTFEASNQNLSGIIPASLEAPAPKNEGGFFSKLLSSLLWFVAALMGLFGLLTLVRGRAGKKAA